MSLDEYSITNNACILDIFVLVLKAPPHMLTMKATEQIRTPRSREKKGV